MFADGAEVAEGEVAEGEVAEGEVAEGAAPGVVLPPQAVITTRAAALMVRVNGRMLLMVNPDRLKDVASAINTYSTRGYGADVGGVHPVPFRVSIVI